MFTSNSLHGYDIPLWRPFYDSFGLGLENESKSSFTCMYVCVCVCVCVDVHNLWMSMQEG